MARIGVIIAAGGKGRRLGNRVPKQFLPVGGVPILRRSVELFALHGSVEEIVVTCPPASLRRAEKMLAGIRCGKIISVVPGGEERQDSVWNGLMGFLSPPDIVLVHDAVRPFVARETVDEVIAAAKKFGAAVVGWKLQDTIKTEEKKGYYARTLDRSKLWAVQTPQAFRYPLLMKGHRKALKTGFRGTDDASLVEMMGLPVRIVAGDRMNIKITTPEDLRLARIWLKQAGKRPRRT